MDSASDDLRYEQMAMSWATSMCQRGSIFRHQIHIARLKGKNSIKMRFWIVQHRYLLRHDNTRNIILNILDREFPKYKFSVTNNFFWITLKIKFRCE